MKEAIDEFLAARNAAGRQVGNSTSGNKKAKTFQCLG
jgi:hypothetical protein